MDRSVITMNRFDVLYNVYSFDFSFSIPSDQKWVYNSTKTGLDPLMHNVKRYDW